MPATDSSPATGADGSTALSAKRSGPCGVADSRLIDGTLHRVLQKLLLVFSGTIAVDHPPEILPPCVDSATTVSEAPRPHVRQPHCIGSLRNRTLPASFRFPIPLPVVRASILTTPTYRLMPSPFLRLQASCTYLSIPFISRTHAVSGVFSLPDRQTPPSYTRDLLLNMDQAMSPAGSYQVAHSISVVFLHRKDFSGLRHRRSQVRATTSSSLAKQAGRYISLGQSTTSRL